MRFQQAIIDRYPARTSVSKIYVIRKHQILMQSLRMRIRAKLINCSGMPSTEKIYTEGYNQAIKECAGLIREAQ